LSPRRHEQLAVANSNIVTARPLAALPSAHVAHTCGDLRLAVTAETSLREITGETVRLITALDVAAEQQGLVTANSVSIAEAYFEPNAWFRAIYWGDEPAGFVMIWRDPQERVFYIWRFMVDARFQRQGIGRRALELLLAEARADGVPEVKLSVVPGERGAMAFYERFGFTATGVEHDGQAEMRLPLD